MSSSTNGTYPEGYFENDPRISWTRENAGLIGAKNKCTPATESHQHYNNNELLIQFLEKLEVSKHLIYSIKNNKSPFSAITPELLREIEEKMKKRARKKSAFWVLLDRCKKNI